MPEERGNSLQLLNPQSIRFCQASIKATFQDGTSQDGTSIDDRAAKLRSGRIRPQDDPAIRVFERDGKLFTVDNRRLEAFRRAGVDIPMPVASPQEVADEAWKFTTHNDGVSVGIRGASWNYGNR